MRSRSKRWAGRPFASSAFALALAFGASAASADVINLPALTFAARGPDAGVAFLGTLGNNGATATFYANALLPVGQSVCRVVLYARDNDGDYDVHARLMRKRMSKGTGVGFGPVPEVMAAVQTVAFSMDMQARADSTISRPLVSARHAYWVEIEFPGGALEALAVRILTAATC